MGRFDITKEMCTQISSMIARFWCYIQDKEGSMHWVSWEKLVSTKAEGGLFVFFLGNGGFGFRDLHAFNMAMLAKQPWRLLQNPTSLCGRLLKSKYFPNASVLEAQAKPGCSYTWRSISLGIETLKEGIVWCVGNGRSIKVWDDPWVPRGVTRKPITPRGRNLIRTVH